MPHESTRTGCACPHHPEYVVLLIGTFAFSGAEYWCPYCGYTCGMFGSTVEIPATEELLARHETYKEKYKLYLNATGVLCCTSLVHEGKNIHPDDLPEETKQQFAKDRESWIKSVKAEKK